MIWTNLTKPKNQIFRWIAVCAAVLLLLPAVNLRAQYDLGSLVGTIHDSTGAAVPNVTVTVTNMATGVASVVKTSGSGDYEVPSLRVGQYTVSAQASGYAVTQANNITVSVESRERIDLTLNVGSTQTTVEVSDVALQIETESSQRDQTITNYQSEALPLVNRNYTDLLGLVTGVRQAPTAATTSSNVNSLTRQGAYNVNGQRSVFNNFLLDGMDNNSYGESNQGFDNQIISVPPDSVAAVQRGHKQRERGVRPEFGRDRSTWHRNPAATSSMPRSYEFLRNTDLNAAGFFKPTLIGTNGPVPFRKADHQPQPVWRQLRRPHRARQDVLLSRL